MRIRMTWPMYKRQQCKVGLRIVNLTSKQRDLLALLLLRYPVPVQIDDISLTLFGATDKIKEVQTVINGLRGRMQGFNATFGSGNCSISGMICRNINIIWRRGCSPKQRALLLRKQVQA
jgi:hypothetical protein